jgi:hypothetical protein
MKLRLSILATALALLGACGERVDVALTPTTGPEQAQTIYKLPDPDGISAIAFGAPGRRLTKSAAKHISSKTDVQTISVAEGGNMGVVFNSASGDPEAVKVDHATFQVHPNTMGGTPAEGVEAVEVTMTVTSGLVLDDVSVPFGPSGLTFVPGADLNVWLTGPLAPMNIIVYHIYADGTVVPIPTQIVADGDLWLVHVPVPGFSEYSWDDDDDDPCQQPGSGCWGW